MGSDSSSSDSVQCITDLNTCCTNTDGPHCGDWFFPDGTRLPFSRDIYKNRGVQRVALSRRNNADSPVGIYRCDIPTRAVHSETDNSSCSTS